MEHIKELWQEIFFDTGMSMAAACISLVIALAFGVYIFFIYRLANKSGFYSKNFNKTVALICLITDGLIVCMQTNAFLSLGIVGALSIIRFRNVVKDPYDLLFLFWSISTGMICGVGLYYVGLGLAILMTLGAFLLDRVSMPSAPLLLVVNSADRDIETRLLPVVDKHVKRYSVKSRSLSDDGASLILELRAKDAQALLSDCAALEGVNTVSLLSHDGELRA